MARIRKKSALIGIFILALIAGIYRFVWQQSEIKENSDEYSDAQTNTVVATSKSQVTENSGATQEAGTQKKVSVKTSYKNPGGSDEIGFAVAVNENGVITAASVEVLAKNPTSIKRQVAFAAEFPQAVIGKKLSDLNSIDKVGGSSLTTDSFNKALVLLKAGM